MAAASGVGAAVLTTPTPSFSQFRLTQFVDGVSAPTKQINMAPAASASPPDLSRPGPSQRHTAIRPSPALRAADEESPDVVVTPPTANREMIPSTIQRESHRADTAQPTTDGFGIIDLASTTTRKGTLGPFRDGRVRNPVPRKLKGKTDHKKGNFAVMHMDLMSRAKESVAREAAAQRASESTAQAAQAAQTNKYVSWRKKKQPMSDSPSDAPPGPSAPPAPTLPPVKVLRTRLLTAEETKQEQARLLTLLRSINPLAVVDQLCTAVAFFGGIPSAPPPEKGVFPESAEANGSGGLFLGWLSEIFPDPSRCSWPDVPEPPPAAPPVKRGRGRPKGSKGTKARKDKGIKKGPKLRPEAAGPKPASTADNGPDGWVDISHSSHRGHSENEVDSAGDESDIAGDVEEQLHGDIQSASRGSRQEPAESTFSQLAPGFANPSTVVDHEFTVLGQAPRQEHSSTLGRALSTPGKRKAGQLLRSMSKPGSSELEENSGSAGISVTTESDTGASSSPKRRQGRPAKALEQSSAGLSKPAPLNERTNQPFNPTPEGSAVLQRYRNGKATLPQTATLNATDVVTTVSEGRTRHRQRIEESEVPIGSGGIMQPGGHEVAPESQPVRRGTPVDQTAPTNSVLTKRQRKSRDQGPSRRRKLAGSADGNVVAMTEPVASSAQLFPDVSQQPASDERTAILESQFEFPSFSAAQQSPLMSQPSEVQSKQTSRASRQLASQPLHESPSTGQRHKRPAGQNQRSQLPPGQARLSQSVMTQPDLSPNSLSPAFYARASQINSAYGPHYPSQPFHIPASNDVAQYRSTVTHMQQHAPPPSHSPPSFSPHQQQAQALSAGHQSFAHHGFDNTAYIDVPTLPSSNSPGGVRYGNMRVSPRPLAAGASAGYATTLNGTYGDAAGPGGLAESLRENVMMPGMRRR